MSLSSVASEENQPSAVGRPPWLLPKAGLQALLACLSLPPQGRPTFLASRALYFQAWEKCSSGLSSLRALAPVPGAS